jgi:hypothetical protein
MDQSHVRIWHVRRDQDGAGGAAIIAAVFATMVAWWNLGLPRLVFSPRAGTGSPPDRGCSSHSTGTPGSWCSTRPWWSANPLGMLWPEMDAKFVTPGAGNGGPPAATRRPVIIVAGG